jgi:hypothetical protein
MTQYDKIVYGSPTPCDCDLSVWSEPIAFTFCPMHAAARAAIALAEGENA